MSRVGHRVAATTLIVAAILAMAVAPPGVDAAATFGTPTAAAVWGAGVTFRQPVVLDESPLRVEVVVESSGDTGAFVAEVPTPATGTSTLSYTLDLATGGYLPNTPFTVRWRLTYPDGSTDVGPSVGTTYEDTRFDWQTSTGSVVRVHWYTGDAAFGARALRIGRGGGEGGRLLG
jgi:hypothetical protein